VARTGCVTDAERPREVVARELRELAARTQAAVGEEPSARWSELREAELGVLGGVGVR